MCWIGLLLSRTKGMGNIYRQPGAAKVHPPASRLAGTPLAEDFSGTMGVAIAQMVNSLLHMDSPTLSVMRLVVSAWQAAIHRPQGLC